MRAKTAWTIRWFLNDLLHELNEKEENVTKKAYNRLIDVLSVDPVLIIIDEVDHMLRNSKVIETLRDLHDESGNSFLLIGMQDAERKIKSFPHLYSRFADIVRARPIYEDEILLISEKLSDVPISKKAAQKLYDVTKGEFRRIKSWMYYLENTAKTNSMDIIEPSLISKKKRFHVYN